MSTTLKSLQTQLSQSESELKVLLEKQKISAKEYSEALKKNKKLKETIEKFKQGQLIVSEHAILRYLERIKGIDIEEIKNAILTENLKNMVSTLGISGTYPVEDFRVKLKDGVIITVIK